MGRDAESVELLENLLLPEGTPEGQRRAVTAEGGIITVGAGAGTGKTWVLSSRYARLLLAGADLLPRDILTLTYTEAAASEMRGRIERRVRELMDTPSQLRLSVERREAIAGGFTEAWISTIHSFAARLIRESGLALDVDPRAAVVSGPQEERFWDRIREGVEFANMSALASTYGDTALQRAAAALDGDPTLSAAVGRWGAEKLGALARETAELHASLGHRWEQMLGWGLEEEKDDGPLFAAVQGPILTILRAAWRRAWDTWAEVFDALGQDIRARGADGKVGSADTLLAAFCGQWAERMSLEPDEPALRDFYLYATDKVRLKGGNTKLLKEVKDFLGTTLGVWQDGEAGLAAASAMFGQPLTDQERRLHAALLRFCATAWGLWDAVKRRRGLLSFSDMILHAREALRSGGEGRSFRHILVDEFQDTDPLQFDMIRSLAGEGVSLFAVGDPKQSIYSFRHAEPSLFAATISQAGTRVELDVSFRTRAALLERLNGLFAHIWREGLGASGALASLKFEPLSPAPTEEERSGGTIPPFSVLLSVREGRGLTGARERLAHELGRRIVAWVSEGRTVWDKEERGLRPVRYSDFAVLVRSRGTHDLLERVLAAEGVPAVQDLSRGYFARGEVEDVICLLRAASDPTDDAAVAGWLFSPFSGVSKAEAERCLALMGVPSQGEAAAPMRPIEVVRASLPGAFDLLQRLSLVGQQQGPEGLLALFDRDRRWLRHYKEKERLRVLRNVRRALAIARDFQRDGTSSLAACADWMAHALRQGVVMEEPAWHGSGVNAVLLSTIHASKGLEYPVVAVFDTAARRGGRESSLRPSKALGVVFSTLPDELAGEEEGPFLQGAAWDGLLTSQGELEEDMRLLYVAATRARDGLVVCGLLGEKDGLLFPQKGSWTSLFLEHMAERGECPPVDGGVAPEGFKEPVTLVFPEASLTNQEGGDEEGPSTAAPSVCRASLPDSKGVTLGQLSATSFAMFEWCPLAWRRRYRQGLDLRWESPDRDLLAEEGRGGAELGSLAHWLLARWPSAPGGDDEAELEAWLTDERVVLRLPSYLRDIWRDEKARGELGKWLRCFKGSEAGRAVRDALALGARREAAFRLNLAPSGVTLAGAMDLVWREKTSDGGGLWRVVDYKITLSRKAPPGLYEAQLDFYALVVREAVLRQGRTCDAVDVGLVFLREGSRVERRRTTEWDALRGRILNVARRGAVGDFAPNHEHCPTCPWKAGCPAMREAGT